MSFRIINIICNRYNQYCHDAIIQLTGLLISASSAFSQAALAQHRLYFISDAQAPLPAEKIFLKSYRNEEGRDTLFSHLILQHPANLFMLGDMISRGSDINSWIPFDNDLVSLKDENTNVYALPGNHEYLSRPKNGIHGFITRFEEEPKHGYSAGNISWRLVEVVA
jgi:hypothetical protein